MIDYAALATTHGHCAHGLQTATYKSWRAMVSRCTRPRDRAWKDYGGRGIAVCERWLVFANFLADMGERPSGTTIDRIDNERGYEPVNCRWATRAEQAANQRQSKKLSIDDVRDIKDALATERIVDIAKRYGVRADSISRIKRGLIWKSI